MDVENAHQTMRLKVCKVAELLVELRLRIPVYQRPYKWQAKHVNQLLDDIFHHIHTGQKGAYRIGSIVLHQVSDQGDHYFDIVDGQQRLITLTLLAYALGEKNLALLQTSFSSPITQANIKTNAQLIQTRLKQYPNLKETIKSSLEQQLELVCITLDNLGEAFQFFDSQNARGKPLAPYDLLKAFHLREIPPDNPKQTTQYVEAWENSISPSLSDKSDKPSAPRLDTIMCDVLYPLRRWLNDENGMAFEQHAVNTFKGFSLASPPQWPIAKRLYKLDAIFPNNPLDYLSEDYHRAEGFPFQIEHPIINGKRFFEYIQHYRQQYHYLFMANDSPIAKLVRKVTSYKKHTRTGDIYVRRLFFSTVFFLL